MRSKKFNQNDSVVHMNKGIFPQTMYINKEVLTRDASIAYECIWLDKHLTKQSHIFKEEELRNFGESDFDKSI